MMRKLLLLISLLHCVGQLLAQNYPVKYLDITLGLSNNSVTAIYQDKSGYMWFGTYDGLNRYDGYEFKVFKNELNNKQSLSSNYIFCIQGDHKGNIWIGGANGGSVLNLQTHTFKKINLFKTGVLQGGVSQIKQFGSDTMLVGCEKSGLVVFEHGTYIGKQVPLLVNGKQISNYHVTAIEPETGSSFCWVFIKNHGLFKYWAKNGVLELVTAKKIQANVLLKDKKNILWMGTDEGLFTFNPYKNEFSNNELPHKSIVTNILHDQKNELYIATDGFGVFRMGTGKKPIAYNGNGSQSLLKSSAVWGLFEDTDGNKWFGTLRGGVSMIGISERFFKHVKTKGNNPSENYALSFCEDNSKNIWIGTDGAGLRIWNRKKDTFTAITTSDGLSSNFVSGIKSDFKNYLWIATWNGGVNRIEPVSHTIKHYDLYNPYTKREEKNVWFVYEDHEKKLWVASTKEGTLYLYNRDADTFEVFNPKLLELLCIIETKDGKLWTGNYTDLFCVDKKTRKFTTKKIGYPIRSILEGEGNTLWVGTSEGGLLEYNRATNKFKRYTTAEGLPGNTILRLLKDDENRLWMSTYNGLCMYDPAKNVFRNFSVSDGLQSNQFSYNAAIALSTGELAFGGINGFNVFYPDEIKDTGHKAKIMLSDIFLNNNSIRDRQGYFESGNSAAKILRLPFDQTNVSLDFVALDYENADKIKYAYLLDGWDEHWNYIGKSRKANYSRLSEGIYTFKVKTTDSYGKWTKEETLLVLHVLPPWYRTWWAYSLYLLLLSGIISAYLRYNRYKERMRYEVKLAHMESLKEKELVEKQVSMFTYISHEFRTPLSLIINPLKTVIKQQSEKGEYIPDLGVAHRNARRLLKLIDQLLLFRRAESDADELVLSAINMNVLCDEVFQCFLQQAKEQNVTYKLVLPDNELQVIGDFDKIEICIYNLISNAFKYTPHGGLITVGLQDDGENINVIIEDSGCGIKDEEIGHIFEKFRQVNLKTSPGKGFGIGLFIVKHFMEKHKGDITCKSHPGVGTLFTLHFKKGYNHFEDLPINTVSPKMSELVKELLGENLLEQEIGMPILQERQDNYKKQLQEEIVSEKKSILIIDDNNEVRNYLISLFSSDYIIYEADNGLDGLKLVKKHLPDIVLSDISMEGLSGLDLCKKIKESDGLSHILVILLTATTSQETHLQGITDGADDYMTKPFDNEILKAKVETLLKNRNQLRNYFLENITLREHNQKVPAEYRDFLKNCIEVIEQNLNNENFTIKQFSKAMGMSHNGLYTKIKMISGQTLNGFIRSVRLRRAAVLMLTEDIQIAQAASQVGFEDKKHFREQFVKLFGMTPSEYIKKYRHSFNKELNIIQK